MRKEFSLFKIINTAIILSSVIAMHGCADEQRSSAATKKELLQKTWTLSSSGFIQKDGVDVSAEFAGLTLFFQSNGTYTATNAEHLLGNSGTWTTDETVSSIVLNGVTTVEVLELSSTTLRIFINISDESAGGRASGIGGEFDILLLSN